MPKTLAWNMTELFVWMMLAVQPLLRLFFYLLILVEIITLGLDRGWIGWGTMMTIAISLIIMFISFIIAIIILMMD